MSFGKKDNRTKKTINPLDKVKIAIDADLILVKRWLSQHKAPRIGDNDANPAYIMEYYLAKGKEQALEEVKELL